MSSKEAPYATMHDLPTYQEREKVGSAPWEKDQRPTPSSRGPHFEPCFYPSSQTAPFATNDNQPIPRQNRKMVNTVTDSGNSCTQNRKMATSAPWDRDESHYSAKIRCSGNTGGAGAGGGGAGGGRSAPFATESNNKK